MAGCAVDSGSSGGLYTYVDGQGNLVTVERQADTSSSSDGSAVGKGDSEEVEYQTDDQVQAKLEARDRNRFVTFKGPDGQLVRQKVDLVAERENKEAAGPAYQALGSQSEYIERIVGLRADCCAHTRERASPLGIGQQLSLSLGEAEDTVLMDRPMPAMGLRLAGDVASLTLRSFIAADEKYLHPGVIFMDALGVPLTVVDRPFQRRFPETWYRYAFFEGELPVPEGARYVAFYLPYAALEPSAGVTIVPEAQGRYEVAPSLRGEFTVTGQGAP